MSTWCRVPQTTHAEKQNAWKRWNSWTSIDTEEDFSLFCSHLMFLSSVERSGSRSASMGLKGFLGKAKRWTWSIQSYCLLSEASRKTGGRRDLEVWPIAVSAPSILITDPPLSVGHLLSRRVMGKGWGIGTALLHFLCCSERQSARRMFAVISKRDWLSRTWIKEGI